MNLDGYKMPLLVLAVNEDQLSEFRHAHGLRKEEVVRITGPAGVVGRRVDRPLLMLECAGRERHLVPVCDYWRERGGVVIPVVGDAVVMKPEKKERRPLNLTREQTFLIYEALDFYQFKLRLEPKKRGQIRQLMRRALGTFSQKKKP